jgi:pimeloyl-ACP methyl ester carboxylesterase
MPRASPYHRSLRSRTTVRRRRQSCARPARNIARGITSSKNTNDLVQSRDNMVKKWTISSLTPSSCSLQRCCTIDLYTCQMKLTTPSPCRFFVLNLLLVVFLIFNHIIVSNATADSTISADDMAFVLACASLSSRVYRWDDIGFDESFETYYESKDRVDAVVVAVYPNQCIVAFRGTKPFTENQVDGYIPDVTLAAIVDILSNAAFKNGKVYSKTDNRTSCTVGEPMVHGYFNTPELEAKIDTDCVATGRSLVLTGHSQGANLAQVAAVRYEQQQPRLILFAPAPAFFDDDACPTVPDERIVNFANTEMDPKRINHKVPVQYDLIPFADVFLNKYLNQAPKSFWSLFPEQVFTEILRQMETSTTMTATTSSSSSSLTDMFIGSWKGEFFILNPDELPSAAYVAHRDHIFLNNSSGDDDLYASIDVDVLDVNEMLNVKGTNLYGERFISVHDMSNYIRKLTQLYEKSPMLVANGFETFTHCNPGAGYMQCVGFCTDQALLCSQGGPGEACSNDSDCVRDSAPSCNSKDKRCQ